MAGTAFDDPLVKLLCGRVVQEEGLHAPKKPRRGSQVLLAYAGMIDGTEWNLVTIGKPVESMQQT